MFRIKYFTIRKCFCEKSDKSRRIDNIEAIILEEEELSNSLRLK